MSPPSDRVHATHGLISIGGITVLIHANHHHQHPFSPFSIPTESGPQNPLSHFRSPCHSRGHSYILLLPIDPTINTPGPLVPRFPTSHLPPSFWVTWQ